MFSVTSLIITPNHRSWFLLIETLDRAGSTVTLTYAVITPEKCLVEVETS